MGSTTSRDLRVALIATFPPEGRTHAGRGIGPYTKQLAQALSVAGVDVDVIANDPHQGPQARVEDGIVVRRVWREGLGAIRDIRAAVNGGEYSIVHVEHELFAFGSGLGVLVAGQVLSGLHPAVP